MDKDLLAIRWVTFVALVSIAAIYLFPRIEGDPRSLIVGGFLILLAAGSLSWAVAASLSYVVGRVSPSSAPHGDDNRRERETTALIQLQSSAAQQDLPSLLGELSVSLRAALGADLAIFWLPDGLPGGLVSPILLPDVGPDDYSGAESLQPAFLSGIWQTLQHSREPLALESLAPGEVGTRVTLLAVPLAWRDAAPVGLLLLGSQRPLELSERQALLVQTLAGEAGLIVHNARLIVQVEYQAVVDERTRLAREIHDGLAQTLAFLKIQSAQMQYFLQQGRLDRLHETLAASHQTLGEAYQDARQAIDNLRSLPETSTRDWLLHIARDFEASSGLPVDSSSVCVEYELPPTLRAQLIRIVQEALSNVRKHAHASSVILSVEQHGDNLVLEVQDDGLGFDPARTGGEAHYGLIGMRERAAMIGAELEVEAQPGAGTRVRLHLPLPVGEQH
jgi:signal transduction histidine kinase